jgi:hypothetical protein
MVFIASKDKNAPKPKVVLLSNNLDMQNKEKNC